EDGIRDFHVTGVQTCALPICDQLEQQAQQALQVGDRKELLRARRDRALLLLGFWRGFRSDELCRLRVEHIEAVAGSGMTLYLPQIGRASCRERGRVAVGGGAW